MYPVSFPCGLLRDSIKVSASLSAHNVDVIMNDQAMDGMEPEWDGIHRRRAGAGGIPVAQLLYAWRKKSFFLIPTYVIGHMTLCQLCSRDARDEAKPSEMEQSKYYLAIIIIPPGPPAIPRVWAVSMVWGLSHSIFVYIMKTLGAKASKSTWHLLF